MLLAGHCDTIQGGRVRGMDCGCKQQLLAIHEVDLAALDDHGQALDPGEVQAAQEVAAELRGMQNTQKCDWRRWLSMQDGVKGHCAYLSSIDVCQSHRNATGLVVLQPMAGHVGGGPSVCNPVKVSPELQRLRERSGVCSSCTGKASKLLHLWRIAWGLLGAFSLYFSVTPKYSTGTVLTIFVSTCK